MRLRHRDGIRLECNRLGIHKRVSIRCLPKFNRYQSIFRESGAEFQGQILEKCPIVNGDDHLPMVLLCNRTQERSELNYVDFVH